MPYFRHHVVSLWCPQRVAIALCGAGSGGHAVAVGARPAAWCPGRCPTGPAHRPAHLKRGAVDAGLCRLVRQPRRLLDHHVLRALGRGAGAGPGLLPILSQPHQPGVSLAVPGWAPAAGATRSGPVRCRRRLRPAVVARAARPAAARAFRYQRPCRYGPRWLVDGAGAARLRAAAGLRPAHAGRIPPLPPLPRRQFFGP